MAGEAFCSGAGLTFLIKLLRCAGALSTQNLYMFQTRLICSQNSVETAWITGVLGKELVSNFQSLLLIIINQLSGISLAEIFWSVQDLDERSSV